jgi:hypothetical protein
MMMLNVKVEDYGSKGFGTPDTTAPTLTVVAVK